MTSVPPPSTGSFKPESVKATRSGPFHSVTCARSFTVRASTPTSLLSVQTESVSSMASCVWYPVKSGAQLFMSFTNSHTSVTGSCIRVVY